MSEIGIAARFNGPPGSGNGGYSCGVLAAFIDGTCRVRLHVPPPLDTALTVRRVDSGGVQMYDGDTLVGSAVPAALALEVPPAPTLAQAVEASKGYLHHENHSYPTCFVCAGLPRFLCRGGSQKAFGFAG